MKYCACAFGTTYLDCKGILIEESENFYVIVAEGYGIYNLALPKTDRLIKIFDTEHERDEWIRDQRYQYDPR